MNCSKRKSLFQKKVRIGFILEFFFKKRTAFTANFKMKKIMKNKRNFKLYHNNITEINLF